MTTLVTGIGELATLDDTLDRADHGEGLGLLHDAAVVVGDMDEILWVGRAAAAPEADHRRDVGGRAVIPAFVDSHTHLVFAGDRSGEFAARMTGTAYDGGGIATTVAATREASDDELRALLGGRLAEMRRQGSNVIEIKSGYGLSVEGEERAMRLAREVTDEVTFLGGHVVPTEFASRRGEYVERGFPLRYSLIIGARAARGAPRPGWVGVGAHRALVAELAGFARPCVATCRSRARRRRPGAGVCGTAVRGCEHSCG